MFITTFYSYKGGVGRSLALANVAAELANRGKTVLIADFDLEAPGVASFAFGDHIEPAPIGLGVVDFIGTWMAEGKSPNVRDYVHQCAASTGERGAIWVMPAGLMDRSYGSRLSQIDFGELYEKYDGFLLFEDLKAQWKEAIRPDYVLVDSRTGHTDIGGVCTRQLPDLVTFVFWPNTQNLNGLSLILHELKEEEEESKRNISKLFVPSNLPTLDDEYGVLRDLLKNFQMTLDYKRIDEVRLFNYPSLDLLAQKIFTIHRPNSRLATEYKRLADAVQMRNVADEYGVRLYLEGLVKSEGERNSRSRSGNGHVRRSDEDRKKIDQFCRQDWQDPLIIRNLALLKAMEGEFATAVEQANKIVARRQDSLVDHLRLAHWAMVAGVIFDAHSTINRLLDDDEASQPHVLAAFQLAAKMGLAEDRRSAANLAQRPAVRRLTLGQLARVCDSLAGERTKILLAGELVRAALMDEARATDDIHKLELAGHLSLPLIGSGFFREAQDFLEHLSVPVGQPGAQRRSFNLAVAIWGSTGEPPRALFEEVIRMHDEERRAIDDRDPNYTQCLALACAAVGAQDRAREFLGESLNAIQSQTSAFSCWSYQRLGEKAFTADLDEMREWMTTGEPRPKIFRLMCSDEPHTV